MKRLALAIIFVLGFAPPAWADFQDGVAAYNRGDYATAFREMKPLAEQSFAIAQFNLGILYANGRGVPQDDAEAVKWYRKAAGQGVAIAQPVATPTRRGPARADGVGVATGTAN